MPFYGSPNSYQKEYMRKVVWGWGISDLKYNVKEVVPLSRYRHQIDRKIPGERGIFRGKRLILY